MGGSCVGRARKSDGHARRESLAIPLRKRRNARASERLSVKRLQSYGAAAAPPENQASETRAARAAPPLPERPMRPSSPSEGDDIVGSRRAAEAGRPESRF